VKTTSRKSPDNKHRSTVRVSLRNSDRVALAKASLDLGLSPETVAEHVLVAWLRAREEVDRRFTACTAIIRKVCS